MKFPKPEKRGRKPRQPIRRTRRPRALSDHAHARELADTLSSVACRAEHALGVAPARAGIAKPSGCEVCGAFAGQAFLERPGALQWAHGITRGRPAVRYHPSNTFALCSGCHTVYTFHAKHAWPDVHAALVGPDAYQAVLAANSGKRKAVDLALVALEAENRIMRLPQSLIREWALERAEAAHALYARRMLA